MGNTIDEMKLLLLKRDEEFFKGNKKNFINFFIKEISSQNSVLFDEKELKEFAKKVYSFLFRQEQNNSVLFKNYLFSFKKRGVDTGSLFLKIFIFMEESYISYLQEEKKDLVQSLEEFIYLFKKKTAVLDSFVESKKENKKRKDEKSLKNGSLSEIFEKAKKEGKRVKLLNFYRGIPIENEADILECDDNMVVLRTSTIQEMAMKLSNRVLIKKEDIFPQTVKAEIEVVNFMNNSVVIKNPRYYFESDLGNKLKNLKVEPKFPQSVKIGKNLRIFNGWVSSISLKSISLMSEEDICQKSENINIEFCLDKDDNRCVNLQMRVEEKYLRNGYHYYVGVLIPDKEGEKKISDFIERRKDEAILELKEELEYYMV